MSSDEDMSNPPKTAKDIPADVERYVQEGTDQGMDTGKAWAVAWSRFCAYKSPGHESCSMAKGDYFPGRKASEARVALRFLEAASVRIAPAIKAKVNAELRAKGMDGNGRFLKVTAAVADVQATLQRYNLDWDGVLTAGQFQGDSGRANLDIAVSTQDTLTSVGNTALAIHWTLLGDKFEVVAYLG